MADSRGILFGLDVSHHQKFLDLRHARPAGFDYVIARVGQGAGGKYGTTKDRKYQDFYRGAKQHGLLLVAYWYIGNSISPEENARLCAEWMGDTSIPVALDCEEGSGDIRFYRRVLDAFEDRGLRVPLSYIPSWYWRDHAGRQSLAGLPPLWSSRYPDMNQGSRITEYQQVPESYWNGYGGNTVKVLQYTSSGRIPGYNGSLDFNAFRGDRGDFAALVGGQEEDDMPTVKQIVDGVWRGTMITNREDGVRQHPETMISSIQERLTRIHLEPMQAKLDTILAVQAREEGIDIDEVRAALLPGLIVGIQDGLLDMVRAVVQDVSDDEDREISEEFANAVVDELADRMRPRPEADEEIPAE